LASITTAKVVPIKDNVSSISIEIPADFLESTVQTEAGGVDASTYGHAVIIFTPSTRIIKIYPAKSGEVARIEVSIGELTPDFLQDVSTIFLETAVKTLYSTGVCFTSEACLYEVYADKSDLPEDISIDELKQRLLDIRGVNEVKFEFLTASSDWQA
jgi:hypothetical protein